VWRERGKSRYEIRDLLLEAGRKSARGGNWCPSSIKKIEESRCYLAEYRRCKRVWPIRDAAGNLLAPIAREQFEAVQASREQMQQRKVGRPSDALLLRGWVHCPRCDARATGQKAKSGKAGTLLYYRCNRSTNQHREGQAACSGSYSPAAKVDQVVWAELWRLLLDPARLRKMAAALIAEEQKGKPIIKDPRLEMEALQKRIARVLDMVEHRQYTLAEGDVKLRDLRNQMATLEIEARALGRVVEIAPLAPLAAIERTCRAIADPALEPQMLADRREILEKLLDLRVVVADGEVEISGNISVAAAADAGVAGAKKNRSHRLSSVSHSFEPIPFRITARLAA
jgi:hypothetical protein